MASNKETIQSAILSQCGKTLPYKRRKRIIAGNLFCVDLKMMAIRTLPLGCASTVDSHALQYGNCNEVLTQCVTRCAGRPKEIKKRSSKQRFIQELSLRQESVMEKSNLLSTQAIHAYDEQERRNS